MGLFGDLFGKKKIITYDKENIYDIVKVLSCLVTNAGDSSLYVFLRKRIKESEL